MLGYICALFRYYHPAEFVTAYLNNATNDKDIADGSALAALYGVTITTPRFGYSKSNYFFDRENATVYKGISSIKFLNPTVADELYTLAQNGKPTDFTSLLYRMKEETSINARQREILIKLDYFSEYGNGRKLLKLVNFFDKFKEGEAKSIRKDGLDPALEEIVKRHATDLTKSGSPAKSYTFTDLPGVLHEIEGIIQSQSTPDFSFREKVEFQKEFLGYVDLTTGDPKDRRKLLITDVFHLVSKKDGKPWAHAVSTRSIGSGKTSRLTVRDFIYRRKPLQKGHIIYAAQVQKDKKGYWNLNEYDYVLEESK